MIGKERGERRIKLRGHTCSLKGMRFELGCTVFECSKYIQHSGFRVACERF